MNMARSHSSMKQVILSVCNGVRSWYVLTGWEIALPSLLPLLMCTLGLGHYWPAIPHRENQGDGQPSSRKNLRANQEVASEKETKKLRLLEMENKLLMEKVMEMEVALKKFL